MQDIISEFLDRNKKDISEGKRCPKCGSNQIYFRIRNNSHICRRCGYIW